MSKEIQYCRLFADVRSTVDAGVRGVRELRGKIKPPTEYPARLKSDEESERLFKTYTSQIFTVDNNTVAKEISLMRMLAQRNHDPDATKQERRAAEDDVVQWVSRQIYLCADPALRKAGLVPFEGYALFYGTDELGDQVPCVALYSLRCQETLLEAFDKLGGQSDRVRSAVRRYIPKTVENFAGAHAAGYFLGDVIKPENVLIKGKRVLWTDLESLRIDPCIKRTIKGSIRRRLKEDVGLICTPQYAPTILLAEPGEETNPNPIAEDIETLSNSIARVIFGLNANTTEDGRIVSNRLAFIRDGRTKQHVAALRMPGLDTVVKKGMIGSYETIEEFGDELKHVIFR